MRSLTAMRIPRILAVSAILLVTHAHALAQKNYTLSGTIYEKGSRETLPFVVVYCSQLDKGTTANPYGFYSITLPEGEYDFKFSFTGFQAKTERITMNKNIQLDMELIAGIELKEVVVSAEDQRKVSQESRMSVIQVPVEKVKEIPALLGEKDVLKVLQLLPGVQKGSEGNSGLYVRGGGPDQNLIILDDATVYNAYHLFGFFSLFNGDALKSIELTKGGFPARYGGRTSSVLDMQMKEGNREKFHGEAGIGLIASRLLLEGPILKNKASFLVSGRRTYIDAFIYPLLPAEAKGGYFFYDLNAKVNWSPNEKNRLYLSGYFGRDKFYFSSKGPNDFLLKGDMSWGNTTGTLRWNHIVNNKLFSNTAVIYSNYQLGLGSTERFNKETFELRFSSGIQDWSIKQDFDFFPSPDHHIRFGALGIYHTFTPSATVVKGAGISLRNSARNVFANEGSLYIEDDMRLGAKTGIQAGLRLVQYYTKPYANSFLEPRLSARYSLTENTSIKASYARMNQFIHLVSSSGISLPTDLWVPATEGLRPIKSDQVAAGAARDLGEQFSVSIEGYYKWMKDISFYKEGASFLAIDDAETADGIRWEDNLTQGKGTSYGAELLVQKNKGKWTGWIGYTLSWTYVQFDSINFGKRFFPRYDRRHDIGIVNVWKMNEGINISLTWVFGTGNAITLPLARYSARPHDPATAEGYGQGAFSGINTNWREDFGEKNSFRMAAYHRLDLAIQFVKQLKRATRTFEFGVYNAYNRYNPFFYFIETNPQSGEGTLKQITLFPLIPSVSCNWKF